MYFELDTSALDAAQALCVALPAAGLPALVLRYTGRGWSLVAPLSVVATIVAITVAAESAEVLTWIALLLVPPACALALGWAAHGARPWMAVLVVPMLVGALIAPDDPLGRLGRLCLIVGSCVTVGRLLAGAAPLALLKAGVVAMATIDAVFIFGDFFGSENALFNAAVPAGDLPRLQVADLGDVSTDYGDFFVAGLVGGILAFERRPQALAALATFVVAQAFNQLFLVVDSLPGTVPPALVLLAFELPGRRARPFSRQGASMAAMPQDTAELEDILVRRADGETIVDANGRQAIFLAAREEITITWYRLQPGDRGPEPHVHHEHADAFYVLDGELSFILGPDREQVRMGAGGLVAAPPNFVHTFVNESDAEARFLNLHTPDGGFAAYMRGLRDGDPNASFDTFDPPEDGGLPLGEAILAGPGEGERLVRGNRTGLLKGVLPDACFVEFSYDGPADGPDLHEHDAQVDSFFVLEGELELTIEDSQHVAGPETLASVPSGVVHTFAVRTPGTTRFFNVHAPDGGFGDFLRRDWD